MRVLHTGAGFIENSRLISDYINHYKRVAIFYPSHFRDESSWHKVMDRIAKNGRSYAELARILKRQNQGLGADDGVFEKLDKLADGKAFVVVTGQQAGIFTGPLYTIYKAMTVIELSRHLSEKYGVDFIPVFWVESNDHDLKEANHIFLLDSESEPVKLEYMPSDYTPECSIKDITIDDNFYKLIDDLESSFPDTEFKDGVFEIIRKAYQPSESISQGFSKMMTSFFSKYGMVFLEPSDPEIKRLAIPIFQQEIKFPLRSMEIVNSAGAELKAMDYESQIEKSADSTCLFFEKDKARLKLFFRNSRFENDDSSLVMTGSELLNVLQEESWRFSPNVALRPVVQDYMLPTVAYVAGPGETSYFAQLSGIYRSLDVNMPIIYPRASFTIVESKVLRIMEKNNLNVTDLLEHHDELFVRLSKQIASEKLDDLIESSRSKIESTLNGLSEGLTEFDPNLKGITESVAKKIDHQINILKQKAYQAQRSRSDIMRNQIKRACMNIHPTGKMQERVFNIVQYLVLYDLEFLEDVLSFIDIHNDSHLFLAVE